MNSTQDENINIVLPIHIFTPGSLFVEVALVIDFHPNYKDDSNTITILVNLHSLMFSQ